MKIVGEHLAYGRRFYAVEDSISPGKPHDFEADAFDRRFKVTASTRFKQRVFTARHRQLQ
ncbi:hypothetical protein [Chitinophaga sp. MM2321]|uniref:hypothetical protein n=1 Tax=Chitinophaga sp. MM2321 TaxID=3137178 RepID=UPI0032D57CB9